MKKLLTLALALMFAGSVYAHQCPALIAQIDQTLESQDVPADVKEQVMSLRDQGETYHDEGDHDASVEKLEEAIEMLAESAYDVDAY
mgnify:CR=1 FL=1